MPDVHSPEQRRRNMSAIKGRNTKPELTLRRRLHRLGYRFRLHRKDLPGRPDLVFPSKGKVIFVHGCFWHSHDCRYGQVVPRTNAEFWSEKRKRTMERDAQQLAELRALGWSVLVIWECELRDVDTAVSRAVEFLEKQSHLSDSYI